MMSKPLTRLLSLVLALTMFLSSVPFARATDSEIVADPVPEETVVTTEAPAAEETEAATEPAAEPEETEPATEPAAEPEETVAATEPAAEPEETEPATEPAAEPEETEAATEPAIEETEPATEPEETEPATEPAMIELPCGFNGMPEDYELSEEELAAKQELIDFGTVATLEGLTAGKDYAADEVIFSCDSEEYANMVAYAYNAELVDYSYGVAVIRLQDATVLDAVKAAADMELPLPAVDPNYITTFEPIVSDGGLANAIDMYALPERQSWETWVMENLADPDPAISNPRFSNFQYFHDVINSYEAWGVTTGSSAIKVAVIDTGVASHEDLPNVTNIKVVSGTSDISGHGTHVAGIIGAALGNGLGGAGVAPGVQILNIRAAEKYSDGVGFSDANIAKAINAAVDNGANIINMSLGGAFPDTTLRKAISNAVACGVTIVVSMGNDGTNGINYPAAYDGVIAVVSTDATNRRAFYSNYGAWADVCAPGSDIYSTYPDGYASMDGTSMAAPVVAGVCALYMSAVGPVSPATMESVLKKNANKISDKEVGAGIVDAAKMFDKIVDTPTLIVCTDTNGNGSVYDTADTYDVPKSGATVICDQYIDFLSNTYDERHVLIYTINGKTPSVKNGQIVNGIQYTGAISLEPYVGQTITVRAAAVTGMGKISKVVTTKLKVEESNKIESISITAPQKVIAGKSVQLAAVVKPAKAEQAVTWSIISRTGDTAGVTIAANGTLKTQAKKSGTVTVQAVSKADNSKKATCTITIETINPVATITLDKKSANTFIGDGVQIILVSLMDKNKNPISADDCGVQWTSSNKKVATVDEYGYVTGLAKGKVTITCKVLDGSGKKATCTVNVQQAVEYIEITGNDTIPAGGSATYKAVVTPTTANNKSVIWELIDAPAGATITAKGVVKVPKGIANGTSFKVRATAKDTGYVYAEKRIYVAPKTSAVNIDCTGGYYGGLSFNKNGWVSGAKLFNVNTSVDGATGEWVQLEAYTVGNNYASVQWSTSNAKVATVTEDGFVEAIGKGTATITCKALDGSGKKATVKVTVTVPVSQISLKSSAIQMTSDYPCVAIGKSVKNTVVFGDTYGKPTTTKVTWSYKVYAMDTEGNKYYYTDYSKNNKLLSLSGGTLKINSAMKSKLWDYCYDNYLELMVDVIATATDGSGVSGKMTYYVNPPTTKLYFTNTVLKDDYGYYYLKVYCNQPNDCAWTNQRFFTVTSSNPKVISVYDVEPVYYTSGGKTYRDWGYYYIVMVPHNDGKAKITITSADGTNLKSTLSLNVN